jgi:ribosomal protein L21E
VPERGISRGDREKLYQGKVGVITGAEGALEVKKRRDLKFLFSGFEHKLN